MKQLTVNDLLALCKQAVKEGHGSRKIVISDDNEGNAYHGMFYGFTPINEGNKEYYPIYDSQETDVNKVIVLG